MEQEDNKLVEERREKLKALRSAGQAYPNDFRRKDFAADLHQRFGAASKEQLEKDKPAAVVAGRMMLKRVMGKASFATLQDGSGRIQLYITQDTPGYEHFKHWDLGDIVGAEGTVFKTMKGELTVNAKSLRLLAKALRPLPEKFHGLADQEMRYRQRYVDLIVTPDAKDVFLTRSKVIQSMRDVLRGEAYLEVETPMMQPIPGGAAARPFKTHHNALDLDLYLRIAPELYLKRLLVGGIPRVYEINRNFRNEGISTRHNPEFTMLEFYAAYADFSTMIEWTEEMLAGLAERALPILGAPAITYSGAALDFARPWRRFSVREALAHHGGIDPARLEDAAALAAELAALGLPAPPGGGYGHLLMALFEHLVEPHLVQPTFIVDYPVEVSPLSKQRPHDPRFTERFELYAGGMEIANGFSELNDPDVQAERFREQLAARERGDLEAHLFDHDYVRALEHGMPPAGGEGIGIDRLTMLFADRTSIRDVILFPLLRPEAPAQQAAAGEGAAGEA